MSVERYLTCDKCGSAALAGEGRLDAWWAFDTDLYRVKSSFSGFPFLVDKSGEPSERRVLHLCPRCKAEFDAWVAVEVPPSAIESDLLERLREVSKDAPAEDPAPDPKPEEAS